MAKKRAAPKRAAKKTVSKSASKAVKRTAARGVRKSAPKKAAPRSTAKAGPARSIVVTVGDQDLPAIHKVASHLRSRGMKVDSVLEATGMITGTYAKEPSGLSRVKGVTGVEETTPIQLPPPGSDIQ